MRCFEFSFGVNRLCEFYETKYFVNCKGPIGNLPIVSITNLLTSSFHASVINSAMRMPRKLSKHSSQIATSLLLVTDQITIRKWVRKVNGHVWLGPVNHYVSLTPRFPICLTTSFSSNNWGELHNYVESLLSYVGWMMQVEFVIFKIVCVWKPKSIVNYHTYKRKLLFKLQKSHHALLFEKEKRHLKECMMTFSYCKL